MYRKLNFNKLNVNNKILKWGKICTNKLGKPDIKLIIILDEILYWYFPQKMKCTQTGEKFLINKFSGNAWQTSYSYFFQKFGFLHETTRRKLVILENMGVIFREFRDVIVAGQNYNNRMFIHVSNNFLNMVFGIDKLSFQECDGKLNFKEMYFSFIKKNKEGGSPQKKYLEYNLYYYIKKLKIRSTHIIKKKINISKNINENLKLFNKPKKLKDFIPLLKQDIEFLQKNSKKNISEETINNILLKISKKLQDRHFLNKQCFLNYMNKIIKFEKTVIYNKNNRTNKNVIKKLNYIDSFLDKVKYDLDIENIAHFKRKLIYTFSREKAFYFIKNFNGFKLVKTQFFLFFKKKILFSAAENQFILKEINSSFNLNLTKQNLLFDFTNKIVQNNQVQCTLWNKVRYTVIQILGNKGLEMDCHWISKLVPQIISGTKEITLIAPTEIVKQYIENKLWYELNSAINKYQYSLMGIKALSTIKG